VTIGIKQDATRPTPLDSLKRYARSVKKAQVINHPVALDVAAKHFGWRDYNHAHKELI
jgi:hypothetical protein